MKKSEYIHEVKPKAAIEASGIKTLCHGRVMVVDHHEALAFETFHKKYFLVLFSLINGGCATPHKKVRGQQYIKHPNEADSI